MGGGLRIGRGGIAKGVSVSLKGQDGMGRKNGNGFAGVKKVL